MTAETTLREVNAYSIQALEALIADIDALRASARGATLEQDYPTAQVMGQALSSIAGVRMQLETRRVALENVRRGWDGEEPLSAAGTFTPTLPVSPA
ncbi:hypothetical protein [Sphingobium sp. MP9-4]|jgi:hypothetical protein|uniref:hypothetical protein n=1 Tax=Sphingobium sp. MP9-4 TaxID=1761936 RepID=UPI0010CA6E69|nr:hypothetical protein [Sphingobium sp. MP9-4]